MKKINIRKILSLFLVCAMLVTGFVSLLIPIFAVEDDEAAEASFSVWDGSTDTDWEAVPDEENAYYITSAAELAGLASVVNSNNTSNAKDLPQPAGYTSGNVSSYYGYTFYITTDIDISAKEWTPIGKSNAIGFGGTLVGMKDYKEGASVIIKGMTINATSNNVGLVGSMGYGGIKNITLENASVTSNSNTAGSFVGYVRYGKCEFENLKSDAKITFSGAECVGGIVAYSNVGGTGFRNCTFTGSITSSHSSAKYIGGIIGRAQQSTTFENCTVVASITVDGANAQYIGGITGYAEKKPTTFENCTVTASITVAGANAKYIGGIAGEGTSSTFTNCSVAGSILTKGSDASCIGGIAGISSGGNTYTDCTMTASITVEGTASYYIGGILGQPSGANDFYSCTVIGDISSQSTYEGGVKLGGIVGAVPGVGMTLEKCYVSSTITSACKHTGGMIGSVEKNRSVTFTDCQFDGIVNGSFTQIGAFIGRYDTDNSDETITFTRCLNTGLSKNTYDSGATSVSWIGLAADANATYKGNLTFTDCASLSDTPILGRADGESDENGATVYTVTINSKTETITASSFDSLTHLRVDLITWKGGNAVLPATISGDAWTAREGMYPVLTTAKDVAPDTYGKADLSWFNGTFSDKTFLTENELLGLARIHKLFDTSSVTLRGNETLKETVKGLPDDFEWIQVPTIEIFAEQDRKIEGESTYDVRFLALIDSLNASNYGFIVTITYKDGNGEHKINLTTDTKSTVFSSICAAGETIDAPEGKYFGCLTIQGIPNAINELSFHIVPFLTLDDGTVVTGNAVDYQA